MPHGLGGVRRRKADGLQIAHIFDSLFHVHRKGRFQIELGGFLGDRLPTDWAKCADILVKRVEFHPPCQRVSRKYSGVLKRFPETDFAFSKQPFAFDTAGSLFHAKSIVRGGYFGRLLIFY
jgi:hypothetical protein